ncbi:adenylyl-sulfate kinase [Cellulomonas composti]|uniref:adenylyl-sulfate kinase n=1 Tax=Cellulomonas composti TaxID=266130 RepID=A0A511JB31_9CELL|nr:adenylyl-sulfate kinase [Cellulomonas composti]GEL95184.1 hypothetical protein CCO02nite_18420 [Cellulomonas composti]
MTDDWARWGALPHVVLADADADAVELALGGGVPAERQPVVATGEPGPVVLADAENTPLAVRPAAGARLEPLRSRALRRGEDADPGFRLPADEVRVRVGAWTRGVAGTVLAVVLDDVIGVGDLAAAAERARELHAAGAVLLCLVGQPRPAHADDVPGAGVVRAAQAAREAVGVPTLVVAVPFSATARLEALAWPQDLPPTLEEIARAYGATDVLDLTAEPGPDRLAYTEVLRAREAVLAEHFPHASAGELSGALATGFTPGAVVLFTGLSGSGKSTVAKAVAARVAETSRRKVTVLDGDEVRHMLSAGLGFDRESRSQNVRRVGYVASLVAGAGGIVFAAAIAPYEADRADVRQRASAVASFVLVHVSTPLEVCEARDRKHLYARARAGDVPEFTGISAPYEEPTDADLVIDTSRLDLGEAVEVVLATLRERGVE